jgi:hexokinase
LADESDDIGFCFSYPTEIVESGDGRLLRFSKEIKAKEVEGQFIGENLNKALLAAAGQGTGHHAKHAKHIVIVNDTVTTLLAGMSAFGDRVFDSYIGFILGTGTNCCYIEQNAHITKLKNPKKSGEQVINIESGGFGKAPGGPIDVAFDRTTLNPGFYTFEKMISGAYLGGLFAVALKTAAHNGLFSARTAAALEGLETLQTSELGSFLSFSAGASTSGRVQQASGQAQQPGEGTQGALQCLFAQEDERVIAQCIGEAIVDRAAHFSAANLAAIAMKIDKGHGRDAPILTTADGTTFYELPGLRQKTLACLDEFLTKKHGQYMEFARVDNAPLIGAAIAGLSRR